jgi:hypothetical protein
MTGTSKNNARRWLQRNIERLKIPARAIHAAVADFEGKGRLIAPEAKWTPGMETNHTQYFLEPAPDGPINVTTIDSLACPAALQHCRPTASLIFIPAAFRSAWSYRRANGRTIERRLLSMVDHQNLNWPLSRLEL